MLTCQILTYNNEDTIDRCLNAISGADEIVIGDMGSQDNTVEICRSHGAKVYSMKDVDHAASRQTLTVAAKNEWQLWLHPVEVVQDIDSLSTLLTEMEHAYYVLVVQDRLILPEIRVWNRRSNLKFRNPVCEYLDAKEERCKSSPLTIYREQSPAVSLEKIIAWRDGSPASLDPIYYEALYHLHDKKWPLFLAKAKQYLFGQKSPSKASILMSYYLAIVMCHVVRHENAIDHAAFCLASKPEMAEFWCLSGDIQYHLLGNYKLARQLYRNAIVAGRSRKLDDRWPIDLDKYNTYPASMIESCDKLLSLPQIGVRLSMV